MRLLKFGTILFWGTVAIVTYITLSVSSEYSGLTPYARRGLSALLGLVLLCYMFATRYLFGLLTAYHFTLNAISQQEKRALHRRCQTPPPPLEIWEKTVNGDIVNLKRVVKSATPAYFTEAEGELVRKALVDSGYDTY